MNVYRKEGRERRNIYKAASKRLKHRSSSRYVTCKTGKIMNYFARGAA